MKQEHFLEFRDMSERDLLRHTAEHALDFLEQLPSRPVSAQAGVGALRHALGSPLQAEPVSAEVVVEALVRDVRDGLLGSAGGRFFGWVIGGGLPAAVAADWLTSVWDQNAALHACSPAAGVVEEVVGEWLKDLLGLPSTASFGLVTGCQMAHVTALNAARHHLLSREGWDVRARGLAGAPRVRVLTSDRRHESLVRAACLLGFGTDAIREVSSDEAARLDLDALDAALAEAPDASTIVCLQAGDINTGAFDPFAGACARARRHGAWVHVDGAFGLWAAVSDRHRHRLDGVDQADSWATDGHKWLNVPFDSGLVFIAHPESHRASLSTEASYLISAGDDARDQIDWNPEWSRRARGFPVYAALRSLGRQGLAALVDRCCEHAEAIVAGIGRLPGAEVVVRPTLNQGLVRFRSADGNHDRRTEQVVQQIQQHGVTWFGASTRKGDRVMRVSVCNWRTTEEDVTRAVESVHTVLAGGASVADADASDIL